MSPTPRAVLLAALGLAVALVPVALDEALWTLWVAVVAPSALALVLDGLLTLRVGRVSARCVPPTTLYIGDTEPLEVQLEASPRGTPRVTLLLEAGALIEPPEAVAVTVEGGAATVQVPLRPRRRGTAALRALWIRWTGPLGLMARAVRVPLDAEVPVTPNVRAVRAAALRLFADRTYLAGLKAQRFLGDGSEFDALREYRAGLDPRALDWKASARHMKLLAREYRAERNHQVVLAFDTGHLMGEPLGGVPKLDRAINAGLLLAYYSLRAGDRVGVFGFDAQVRHYRAPQAGVRAMAGIQHACAALDYSPDETNYTLGLSELGRRLRRRALVVVLTDVVDAITAELMLENLDRLARRHVVLFVSVRDPALDAVVSAQPSEALDVHRAVVAADLVRERDAVLHRLRRRGVSCLDAPPERISAGLLNRYLEIKRRERV